MYTQKVLDHFEHPRNSGELRDASAVVQVSNPVCGDTLELAVKVQDCVITEVRFRAKGCVAAVACASVLTELAQGSDVQKANEIEVGTIISKLDSLPRESMHAASLAVDALKQALRTIS